MIQIIILRTSLLIIGQSAFRAIVFVADKCRGPSAVSALNMLRAGPIHVAVTRWYLSQPLQWELIILQSHYTK